MKANDPMLIQFCNPNSTVNRIGSEDGRDESNRVSVQLHSDEGQVRLISGKDISKMPLFSFNVSLGNYSGTQHPPSTFFFGLTRGH